MKQISVKDFASKLDSGIPIIVRGAFQSGYGKDEDRPDYYRGKAGEMPRDGRYVNREVLHVYFFGETGDSDYSNVKALDIAVSDFDIEVEE